MREFFYGWRRKTACLLLAGACVLIFGWVRSYSVRIECRTPLVSGLNIIGSGNGAIEWTIVPQYRLHLDPRDVAPPWSVQPLNRGTLTFARTGVAFQQPYWQWCGFKFSPLTWTVPYWFLVLPLTFVAVSLFEEKYPADND